jgi:hypothetical protein
LLKVLFLRDKKKRENTTKNQSLNENEKFSREKSHGII